MTFSFLLLWHVRILIEIFINIILTFSKKKNARCWNCYCLPIWEGCHLILWITFDLNLFVVVEKDNEEKWRKENRSFSLFNAVEMSRGYWKMRWIEFFHWNYQKNPSSFSRKKPSSFSRKFLLCCIIFTIFSFLLTIFSIIFWCSKGITVNKFK